MNQDYRFNLNNRGDTKAEDKPENLADGDLYSSPGNVRNLCFAWPDGSKKFLNYSYLVSTTFHADKEIILLEFTTDVVTLKGTGLNQLFDRLLNHLPKYIEMRNLRYKSIDGGIIVTDINITRNS